MKRRLQMPSRGLPRLAKPRLRWPVVRLAPQLLSLMRRCPLRCSHSSTASHPSRLASPACECPLAESCMLFLLLPYLDTIAVRAARERTEWPLFEVMLA